MRQNDIVFGKNYINFVGTLILGNWSDSIRGIPCHHTWHFHQNLFTKTANTINTMDDNQYIPPQLTELELYSEGVLCGSNEVVDDNDGIW